MRKPHQRNEAEQVPSLEQQLADLYAQYSPTPGATGNRCGSCRTCCTSGGLNRQNVTDLELSLLEQHHGPQIAHDFERYARRERDADGQFLFEVCPNLGEQGCGVYAVRPFSCRVFGLFRASHTRLPSECVYQGEEVEFAPSHYYQAVPGALRLRELSRDFQLRRPPSSQLEIADQGGVGLNLNDPWDKALEQIGRGVVCQLPEEQPGESLFASYLRALVTGESGQHAQALGHYRRVLESCPQRSDLMTFAGFHAFQEALWDEAEQLWLRSLQLDAANPLTYSFLGYLYQHRQQWQMAADFFGAAAELQPEQSLHLQRRQHALSQLS